MQAQNYNVLNLILCSLILYDRLEPHLLHLTSLCFPFWSDSNHISSNSKPLWL